MFRNLIHILALFRKEEQHNDFLATEMLVSGLKKIIILLVSCRLVLLQSRRNY